MVKNELCNAVFSEPRISHKVVLFPIVYDYKTTIRYKESSERRR